MKKHLIIGIVAMLILSGCGSSRKTTHEQTHIERADSSGMQFQQLGISHLSIASLLEQSSNKDYQIRLYDTSKPADPVTGLPPVLADIKGSEQSNTKAQVNTTQVDSTAVTGKAATTSSLTADRTKDAEVEFDEPTQIKQGAGFVWALVVLVVVGVVGYLLIKGKKKPP